MSAELTRQTAAQPAVAPSVAATLPRQWWSLRLILVLLFVQLWRDIGGFTVRMDDVVSLLMIGWWVLWSVRGSKLRYYRNRLNAPVLLWIVVIAIAIVVNVIHPLPGAAKQDGVVNGIRLILAVALFFVVANHPLPVARKIEHIFTTVIAFSFVTTFVSLLQIGYWDGWLPFSLPPALTTLKEGANADQGREAFALFLGNTGTHTWSAMLAMQALAVWIVANGYRRWSYRLAGIAYFLLLSFILVRTSVRTSILGLGISLFVLLLIQAKRSPYPFNRIAKPVLLVGGVALVVAAIFLLASQSYYLERIRQAIPQVSSEGIVIDRASNIFGRFDYAANALRIYRAYPLLGGGFESYETFSGTIGTYSMVHAHNSYVQTLAEMGTLGGIALIWLSWAIIRSLLYSPPRSASLWRKQLWYLAVAAFVFLAFAAFFVNPFWEPNQVAFRMILLGTLVHAQRESWQ